MDEEMEQSAPGASQDAQTSLATSGSEPSAANLKLGAIAARIHDHLTRFERDPAVAATTYRDGQGVLRRTALYWNARADVAGSRVAVTYVGYQGRSTLKRAEALTYLAWLDAGGVGRHYKALRAAAAAISRAESV